MSPILLTTDEYETLAFMFIIFGLLTTMGILFTPEDVYDEKKNDNEDDL